MTNATNAAQHRRALTGGISISVAVHVLAIGLITFPAAGTGDANSTARAVDEPLFEALEVVEIAEASVPTADAAASASTSASAPPSAPAAGEPGAGSAAASLDALLADLMPANVAVQPADQSRPLVTARRLQPVAMNGRMAEVASALGLEGEEEGGSGWSDFLGSISLVLSGGGHCPMPTGAGPMILR